MHEMHFLDILLKKLYHVKLLYDKQRIFVSLQVDGYSKGNYKRVLTH